MAKLTEIKELAYLAGIFDGEGCIDIARISRKDRWSPTYRLQCRLAMCNPYIPKLFYFRFGGSVRTFKRDPKWSRQWYWHISGVKAVEFLNVIKPYLRLKRAEADLAITFQENIKPTGGKHLPNDTLAVREAQKILMSKLKDKTGEQ